jgi:hypothetical protein
MFLVAFVLLAGAGAPTLAQMPDLRQMSGQPLPSGELPVGSVSVRVVRGGISNNIPDQDVTLEGGGPAKTLKTDASGRAVFSGLAPGSIWRATTTVDGERLESQAITVPGAGGLRVLLAAGLQGSPSGTAPAPAPSAGGAPGAPGMSGPAAGAPATAPGTVAPAIPLPPGSNAVPGTVAFGSQSRLVIELAEGSVEVYGLFDIVNLSATPVMPASPIVFEAPADASNLSVLEGSSPQAKAEGHRVTVTGPFAPGSTSVQIAYRHKYDGGTLHLAQAVPLDLPQTTVIVRKFGNLRATLNGVTGQREVPLEARMYLVLNGKALNPGERIDLTLEGLPHQSLWPRYATLGIAALLVIGGIFLALQAPRPEQTEDELRTLRARRGERFDKLVSVERRLRQSPDDDVLQERRAALIAEVEELDDALAVSLADADAEVAARDAERAERLGARPAVR